MKLTDFTTSQRLALMCCAIEIVNANGNIAVEELQNINNLSRQLLFDEDLDYIAKHMHLYVAIYIIKKMDIEPKRLFAKTLISFVDCENNDEKNNINEIKIFCYICNQADIDVAYFSTDEHLTQNNE